MNTQEALGTKDDGLTKSERMDELFRRAAGALTVDALDGYCTITLPGAREGDPVEVARLVERAASPDNDPLPDEIPRSLERSSDTELS